MATFVFTQHRLGRTDGVSLEVDKWRKVLEEKGHTVHYVSGNDDVPGGNFIPELYPFHPKTAKIIRNATRILDDYDSPEELMEAVEIQADLIQPQYEAIFDKLKPDVLLPNNLLSVGYNLPGMAALSRIIKERNLPVINHCHDFWWEESGEVYPTCPEVIAHYEKYAPPTGDNISFVTINRLGQKQLKERKGADSLVVPNVFDFDQPLWKADDYNADFRREIGVGEGDLLFLQATRVLDRKAIELAIDVVARLNRPENRNKLAGKLYDGREYGADGRAVLVCAGYVEGIGLSDSYAKSLQEKADRQGVTLVWAGDRVAHSRCASEEGGKIYSLWDSYVHADFVTYPSIWEGWGNQFIEAVFAKLPVVLFEYPVWQSDLGQVGFDVVSLGSEIMGKDDLGLVAVDDAVLDRAVREIIPLLKDADRRRKTVESNFTVAKEHYSYDALGRLIDRLLAGIGLGE